MAEKKKFSFMLASMSLLFLVILPGISWYYLTLGRDWRRAVVAELSEYGSIPPFTRTNARGIDFNFLENSVCVIYTTTDSILTQNDAAVLNIFPKLSSQFHAKENFKLIVLRPDGHPITPKLKAANTEINPNWVEIPNSNTAWLTAFQNGLGDMNAQKTPKPWLQINGTFALSDTKGTIKQYYRISDSEQIKRLVEHIAILLPN